MTDLGGLSILTSILTSDVLKVSAGMLAERLTAAKNEYKEANAPRNSPLETRRHELILKLSSVQNSLMLTVYDQRFLERVLPLLIDQAISAYEAQLERELTIIEMNLGQIEGVLGQYNQRMKERAGARSLAMGVCGVAIVGLFVLVMLGPRRGLTVYTIVPILAIPLPVILWSAIGSFTAILYRFNNSGDIELQDPLRWLFTRPLTGIMIGIVTFFIIKAGLLTLTPGNNTPALGSNELMWLAAFLVGFSDRFSDSLLKSLVGRFGGDKTADLVTLQGLSSQPALPYVGPILDGIAALRNRRQDSTPPAAATTERVAAEHLMPAIQDNGSAPPVLPPIDLGKLEASQAPKSIDAKALSPKGKSDEIEASTETSGQSSGANVSERNGTKLKNDGTED
jgi:hypothetical protein